MNDRFTKIVRSLREKSESESEPEEAEVSLDTEEAPQTYSVTSADRRQKSMVEFRFLNGNAKALAYSYLIGIDFDPSEGLSLDFSQYQVRLRGKNLRPLFEKLTAHHVAFVREIDALQAEATLADAETVVTRIEITDLDAESE